MARTLEYLALCALALGVAYIGATQISRALSASFAASTAQIERVGQ